MAIGSATPTIETVFRREDVLELRFERDHICLVFQDGREICSPLRLYPSLEQASDRQRAAWEMIGPYKGFHWEDLDLDLSIDQLICGDREAIPHPPSWELLTKLEQQLAKEEETRR